MPLDVRLLHSGVGSMKDMFNKKVEEHKQAQLENPFSEWEGAGRVRRLSKEDIGYGRPAPGSKSEQRSQLAKAHVMMEMRYLCDMIWDCAEWRCPDGRAAITFGKLFKLYIAISDKVVGTLLRARKHGFVHFEGEMLYQRRDDDKVIELKRPINTIRARFGQKTRVANGGEVEPWGDDEDDDTTKNSIPRRNSTPGGTNREAPVTEGPSVRRHSLPHSSRSLDSSPERRLTRSTSVEVLDHKPPEIEAAACAPPPCLDITVTCEDTTLDLVEKLHKEIERNCNLLDPEPDALRGRRSRSTTPIPMDTILEDSGDKTGKNQRVAAPTSPRMEPPPEEPGESS
ncbi:uncharacterized protein LOC123506745 isoform X1 [Portunus trituberculatus]|uniref:uncharacterized protein LOC123506745 isoform X1 n=1 Tax=Portunus trituberculatus TaxID=210409 RepID=UPI001E1CDAA3|nr:uncharacterized protein LOC123506745 isoform X1 [Portunus trituberculatus]XP_045114968.1 uncharacterized protein LOC123506745 isoform X1 [Portunus trituberculatus]XP_045114969.1 uncharacterized protein LOC123506745 isoform X1 [Portunus trituberculatus]